MKRAFDLVFSILLLVFLSPVLVLVGILIKLDSKGPLFFRQTRVGKDLVLFSILKFRTMTNEEREVKPVHGRASGVTRTGFYLRRYKVDELPQLWHVVEGKMSLVGPRPSIPEQLDKMSEYEKFRYSVRPGLTGLAQVSGNIHLSWKDRYKLDLKYVKNYSMFNDFKILLRTVLIILKGEEQFKGVKLKLKE